MNTESIKSHAKENIGQMTYYAILSASFIFCYANTIVILADTWLHNDVYTHGFLVPLVSSYLIWIRRDRLKEIPFHSNLLSGSIVLLAAMMVLMAGKLASIILIQELSLILTIVAIVLLLFGFRCLAAIWFPIAYLLFMVPYLRIFTDSFHYPFQVFSSWMASAILSAIGIPSFCYANFIEMPNITLEVARSCSGVNYLVAIIAVGIPVAYLTLRSWTRRLLLVSGAIVIAVIANGVRVALIGVLSYYGISDVLHGPYHVLQALFVAVIGFLVLFIGAWVMSKREASANIGREAAPAGMEQAKCKDSAGHRGAGWPPLVIIAGVLLATGAWINFYTPGFVPSAADLKLFPYNVGEWSSTDVKPDYEVYRQSGVDSDVSRLYVDRDGKALKLYVGYYGVQKQGKELMNYISEKLHEGVTTVSITLEDGSDMTVNRLVRVDGGRTYLILFWYDINGRIVTDKLRVKAYTALDTLFNRRSNGAVVMVTSEIYQPGDLGELDALSIKLIKETAPTLGRYI